MNVVEQLLSFPMTRPFGDLSFPQFGPHTGVDFGLPEGTPLYAIGAGIVTVDDDDPSYDAGVPATWSGIQVTYRLAGDGATITCAHLRVNTVVHGSAVVAGQKIGESGSTGAATGPHLHFEVRDIDGSLVDPIPYLEGLMFTDDDRARLKHIEEALYPGADGQSIFTFLIGLFRDFIVGRVRLQRNIDVERGGPVGSYDPSKPPIDPRVIDPSAPAPQ